MNTATLILVAVLVTSACIAVVVGALRLKNKELRAWALRRRQELRKEGIVVGPRTAKLLEAMASSTGAPGSAALNRFGVPIKKSLKTPKKLGRKQAKMVLARKVPNRNEPLHG